MGFMFRVRLSSFFAGATAASVAGFYFLYKDYMFSQQAIFQKVKGAYDSLDERIDVLNQRIIELEKLKTATAESPIPVETSSE
ncbi:hypothetical protein IEQ34_005545 [Dendrobium chrysotoxum]|uniref:Uncharacterized protein n=1 Tax=Dendrobium chrysotoxum TaxID=161865 RepID=A0AAV7HAG5_DENCH|nr:hypothetical protein IEQ34_005545 [Dendrobium chrysotoxum]